MFKIASPIEMTVLASHECEWDDEKFNEYEKLLTEMPGTPLTFLQFKQAIASRPRPDGQREGQWVMNSLCDVRPDLYRRVTGAVIDPFHVDHKLWQFWAWLESHWEEGCS